MVTSRLPEPAELGAEHGTVAGPTLATLAAIGRAMQAGVDPRAFLAELSKSLQPLVSHDRLAVDTLDDGRAFTVLAEHAATAAPLLHEAHYTGSLELGDRYRVTEWAFAPVFRGEAMRFSDLAGDPRLGEPSPFERRLCEAGLRSGLAVRLRSGGRVVGALVATAFAPAAYDLAHVQAARQVADLIDPFVESAALRERLEPAAPTAPSPASTRASG